MHAHANMTEIFHIRQKLVCSDENLAQQKIADHEKGLKAELEKMRIMEREKRSL